MNELITKPRIPVIELNTSSVGIAQLKRREGLRLHAYEDQGGTRTIGYGHTYGVKAHEFITEERATDLLHSDLSHVENTLKHDVTVGLYWYEFDALASFVFNIGAQGFERSTVLKYLNRGLYRDAAMHMTSWSKVGGKLNKGLWQRRKDEVRQFCNDPTVI